MFGFSAKAAKLRVSTLGCDFGRGRITSQKLGRLGKDNIFERRRALKEAFASSDFGDRLIAWASWYNACYCSVLVENVWWLGGKNISADLVIRDILKGGQPNTKEDLDLIKRSFQSQALKHIKKVESPNAVERIRSKVERWRGKYFWLTGLPGRYSPCIAKRMTRVGGLVPPRVQAAVFTTLWNGWCTHRRFQQRGNLDNICKFKCSSAAKDSLDGEAVQNILNTQKYRSPKERSENKTFF